MTIARADGALGEVAIPGDIGALTAEVRCGRGLKPQNGLSLIQTQNVQCVVPQSFFTNRHMAGACSLTRWDLLGRSHPCTDNPRLNIQRVPYISSATNRTPSWQAGGWEPALIFHVEKMRDWALIRLRRPNQNGFLVRATPWRDSIKIGIPAHIKSLDSYVLGLISILAPGVTKFEPIEQVLAHRSMVACRLLTIRLARKGDAASAHRVALSSYKAWGKANSATGMVEYPLYVDLNIARKWLEQAASLGSSEAKMILDRDFDPVTT